MIETRLPAALLSLVLCASVIAEEVMPDPIAQKGDLLFSDDFERTDLGDPAGDPEVGLAGRQGRGAAGRFEIGVGLELERRRFAIARAQRPPGIERDRQLEPDTAAAGIDRAPGGG